jgi:hypothetical protein
MYTTEGSAASGYSSGTAKVEVAAENLEGMILIGQVFLLMRFLKSEAIYSIILGFVYLVLAVKFYSAFICNSYQRHIWSLSLRSVENNIYAQVAMVR